MPFVLVMLAIIAYGVLIALFRGLVLTSLWNWFVVPLHVSPIHVVQGIGMALIMSFLTHQDVPNKDSNEDVVGVLAPIFKIAVIWAIGFALSRFM
jgi:hypothetical protein